MNPTNRLLLLSSHTLKCGAKIRHLDTGEVETPPMADAFSRTWSPPLDSIDDLHAFVHAQLDDARTFAIHGGVTEAWPEGAERYRRSSDSDKGPATVCDREVSVCALDIDKVQKIAGAGLAEALGLYMDEHFPGVGYVGVASGSFDPDSERLNARVFVLLAVPRSLGDIQAFLDGVPGVDLSLYRPVQPIFLARPTYKDGEEYVADPLAESCVVRREGARLLVPAGVPVVSTVVRGEALPAADWPQSLRTVLDHLDVYGDAANGNVNVVCPWADGHSTPPSEARRTETQVLAPTTEYPDGAFRCLHESCSGRDLVDVQEWICAHADVEVPTSVGDIPLPGAPVFGGDTGWEDALAGMLDRYVLMPSLKMVGDLETREMFSYSMLAPVTAVLPSRPPVGGQRVPTPVYKLWLAHPSRLVARGFRYLPGQPALVSEPDGLGGESWWLNEWRPSPVSNQVTVWMASGAEATSLDGALWEAFVSAVQRLFGDDAEAFLDFVADMIQNPQRRPQFAMLHISLNQGTGRGWIKKLLRLLIGWRNVSSVPFDKLVSRFNDFMLSVLVVCDEIYEKRGVNSERQRTGRMLHELITEDHLAIERKGLPIQDMPVCARLLMLSNHADAVSVNRNDRRYYVVKYEGPGLSEAERQAQYALLDSSHPRFAERLMRVHVELSRRVIRTDLQGRAPDNEVKQEMIESGLNESGQRALEMLYSMRDAGLCVVEPQPFRRAFYEAMREEAFLSLGAAAHAADEAFEAATIGRILDRDSRIQIRFDDIQWRGGCYGYEIKGAKLPVNRLTTTKQKQEFVREQVKLFRKLAVK